MSYSERERQEALDLWFAMSSEMSMEEFVAELGYPSRACLARWARADPRWDPDRPQHRSRPVLSKLEAIRRVSEGASWAEAGRQAGVSASCVGKLCKMYARGGTAALLPKATLRRAAMAERKRSRPAPYETPPQVPDPLPDDPEALRAIIAELRLDNAVLRGVLDVLKAVAGREGAALTGGEKALVASGLEGGFPASALCARLGLPRSTYYARLGAMTRPDPEGELLDAEVRRAFEADGRSGRGYRFVHGRVVAQLGRPVSEKRVRRSMRRQGLAPAGPRAARRYSSYAGEIDPPAPNLLLREDGAHDFRPAAPNLAWASDITEFRLPGDRRKVYLSLVVDLFDGRPVGWSLGTSPDAELANSSLRRAVATLRPGEAPLVHTDRGCHYRWPGWKAICGAAGLRRSMSRKGCSPDNAACEGFFGTFKTELFYGRDWSGWVAEGLIGLLGELLEWWRSGRLRAFREEGRVVWDTIDGRRRRLGLAV